MKQIICILIGIWILLILTGCGDNNDLESDKSNSERYMLGTTLDDGRIIHFALEVPYKDEELGMALLVNKISFNELTSKLKLVETLRDGGSKIYYYDKVGREFGNNEFYMIVCSSQYDSNNIYVAEDIGSLRDQCSERINDLEGVSMKIKEGTLTNVGATIIITDTSGRDNIYGNPYHIEKLENGKWIKRKILIDNLAWTMQGYHVDENNTLEFKINWESIYGKLEKGTYRIVKDTSEPGEEPNHYITTEFTID